MFKRHICVNKSPGQLDTVLTCTLIALLQFCCRVLFSLQCFACSVELGGHKKSHDYHVIVS